MRMDRTARIALCGWLVVTMAWVSAATLYAAEPDPGAHRNSVLADEPIAYWSFEGSSPAAEGVDGSAIRGETAGEIRIGTPGPRPEQGEEKTLGYLNFDEDNRAAELSGGRIEIDDPSGEQSLKFRHGETITVEAWVNLRQVNGHAYVIGKGRTHNEGFPQNNQNWAIRLSESDGGAQLSFLFRSASEQPSDDFEHADEWHRWQTDRAVPAGDWQHIAVTYTFGEPESIRGYINGESVEGRWDMAGPTRSAPVVDDDQVWIGAAMGGGNNFQGGLDEIAIYRRALDPERIAQRYRYEAPPAIPPGTPPDDAVLVEILEGVPDRNWNFRRPAPTQHYEQPTMAFVDAPRKYNDKALIIDRSAPYMLRAIAKVRLPAGEHQLLLRSLNGARLYVDDEPVATTQFNALSSQFDDPVEPLPTTDIPDMPDVRDLPAAHDEEFATITSDGGEHVIMLEAFIGGPRQRFDVGELAVAVAGPDGRFHLLSPQSDEPTPLTDPAWRDYADEQREHIAEVNAERRAEVGEAEAEYWAERHELVREELADEPLPSPPEVSADSPVHNDIDRYINARLEEADVEPAPLADDYAFIRRVTLDTVGVVPSPEEIEAFFDDPPETRRENAIDRLLADPRWADHWVGYWQDVFAENPALINQALNNTGAFRWYLHEAMLDNRPVDRFATEMAMMEGSRYYGGPAGFEMASQNDVPMADKAHTLAQAFMGMNLACARCHDAPFRDFKQEDVFAMAAMLGRGPQKVPESSSVPGSESELRAMLVEVTLEPGSSVEPAWPFERVLTEDAENLPDLFVRAPNDPRNRFAGLLTWHRNDRFAPVVANRLWRWYLGFGLLEPVDDWADAEASHPELLDYLARELMTSGYDMKHVARLILNSHTYQRKIVGEKAEPENRFEHLFASPVRRRMRAEQVLDSLYHIADKRFRSEPLTMDPHSNRPVESANHLGQPRKAWHMTTMQNERDRPSLNLPMAQKITELLDAFGWRGDRQDPRTIREQTPLVQQPAVLANGVVGRRIVRLSDDSAFTEMALDADSAGELVDRLFLRILSREPSESQRQDFVDLLEPGFGDRVVADPPPIELAPEPRNRVTWRNHLGDGADTIRREEEKLIQKGDPPSVRLKDDWRRRVEDVVWALMTSPEFVLIP